MMNTTHRGSEASTSAKATVDRLGRHSPKGEGGCLGVS